MSTQLKKPKVLVIVGPTASGKTALGVKLAAHFAGEIVSADSRQVFRGLDIGTGKDLAEYVLAGRTIPFHLIDVCEPMEEYNLARYQKEALEAIEKIISKGNLPLLVGGSGLYLQAVVDGYVLSSVTPDQDERVQLEKLSVSELYEKLHLLKPDFAERLNNSDRQNARRLVRYLEISKNQQSLIPKTEKPAYDFLILSLNPDDQTMRSRIEKRLVNRLEKEGLVAEVERLLDAGVTLARLNSLGLEYRYLAWYLQDKIDYETMVNQLSTAIYRFAKRQKTWFKRWVKQGREIIEVSDEEEAMAIVKRWLKN
ncbi:MAG: tRNA (adenosine(37)-N6)-dimethylallyltransferase MiaA [Patescibacteria group bacterium]|nr:tRNA (adenosine(37)-N6)-dimethylallyltransferase MiaA [Patescibacteria group bacterium]MDD3435066.1 tRNA (adenosine(37)-N6)-dimethylallyltransferase MiaA [Patescibacteria group bacterium]MDD4466480.1 tRNA (adenosine(37)-N6)-dimethylallyltransferase MiaA [Patescibacteria group bacterium]